MEVSGCPLGPLAAALGLQGYPSLPWASSPTQAVLEALGGVFRPPLGWPAGVCGRDRPGRSPVMSLFSCLDRRVVPCHYRQLVLISSDIEISHSVFNWEILCWCNLPSVCFDIVWNWKHPLCLELRISLLLWFVLCCFNIVWFLKAVNLFWK